MLYRMQELHRRADRYAILPRHMSAVTTHALVKTYRTGFRSPAVVALNQVTLEIPRGEIFGFLGPNGSGKTTLLKCLLNIIFPTSGDLTILDRPVTDLGVRRQIGYLPEAPYFYDRFNALELLEFYGGLYGMSNADIQRRIPVVIEEVGLGMTAARRRLRTYSKGMLQRVGIGQAILAEPELIILDEPSTGLDPVGRRQIKELIRAYHLRGHTVFLNTHILEDIEDLCHRVGVIYKGNVLALETVEELTRAPQQVLDVAVGHWSQSVSDAIASMVESIEPLPDGRVRLELLPGLTAPELIRTLVVAGADLYSVHPQTIRLEDRFMSLIAASGGVPPELLLQQLRGKEDLNEDLTSPEVAA